MDKPKLSRLELEVMEVIWNGGEMSVREIHENLPKRKRPAYTTVQTIVSRLEQKRAVERSGKAGNANVYKPLLSRRSVHRRLVDDMVELFGGAKPIVEQLLADGKLTLDELRELEARAASGEIGAEEGEDDETARAKAKKKA